jgi:hypothetical protein
VDYIYLGRGAGVFHPDTFEQAGFVRVYAYNGVQIFKIGK